MEKTCHGCYRPESRCTCDKQKKAKEEPKYQKMYCQWKDAIGMQCNRNIAHFLPRPGIAVKGTPKDYPADFIAYCWEHYQYESPENHWQDIMVRNRLSEIEQQFGAFKDLPKNEWPMHAQKIYRSYGKNFVTNITNRFFRENQ